MAIQVHQCSVVILATAHNPTILHPAFLRSQAIVPADWEEKASETVCSLPFSRVAYTNGFTITGEPRKLQIIDSNPQPDITTSPAPGVAREYVKTLPHVKHTALGINFQAFIDMSDPATMIADRFVKGGPWLEKPLGPPTCGLRFQYALDIAKASVSIDTGIRRDDDGEATDGILLKINYHNDIDADTAEASAEQIQLLISRHDKYCENFFELSSVLIGEVD